MHTARRPGDDTDGQRRLRILIFAPITLLALAIVVFSVLAGRLSDSISAYYGGPARDVFVGCMLATALGIIAFHGTSDLEDLALNGAGFYAPFVAFVPHDFAASSSAVHAPGMVHPATALRVILVCYLVVALAFAAVLLHDDPWPGGRLVNASSPATRALVLAALGLLAAFLALVVVRLVQPDSRFAGVHVAAAALLVANLAITVASHVVADRHRGAVRESTERPGPGILALYRTLVAGMALGGPVLWLVLRLLQVPSAVLWAEALELGLFMVFWGSEIKRHRPAQAQSAAR